MNTLKLTLAGLAFLTTTGMATAECRQALALGLDVSGSVDTREYVLQMQGVAGALEDPSVQQALLGQPGGHVDLMVFEWSGPQDQHVVQPWRSLRSAADIAEVASRLRQAQRVGGAPTTAIGAAMRMGAAALQSRDCVRRVLDLSGDGVANAGPLPQTVKTSEIVQGITMNGLIIADFAADPSSRHPTDPEGLTAYYQAYVIQGPQAFAELSLGFDDYQDTMTRKLIRELYGAELMQGPGLPVTLASQ